MGYKIIKTVTITATEEVAQFCRDLMLDGADFVEFAMANEDKDKIATELRRIGRLFEEALPVAITDTEIEVIDGASK